MRKLTKDSKIILGSKTHEVHELLATLIYLSAEEVTNFFAELELRIPRVLRIDALKEAMLPSVIKTRAARQTLADELNYRLSWYNEFSDTQLENLIVFFNDSALDRTYFETFWTRILLYMGKKQVSTKDLNGLIKLSIDVKTTRKHLQVVPEFNKGIANLFFDIPGRIDGLTQERFRPVLYRSSTIIELRELGVKYGVNVPKRLRKAELLQIIIDKLHERNTWTQEEENNISKMTVMVMTRYAIDNKIKASTELKKEEIIEYILSNAKEIKDIYFAPSKDAYIMVEPIAPEEIKFDEDFEPEAQIDFTAFEGVKVENFESIITHEIITVRIIRRNEAGRIESEDERLLKSFDEVNEIVIKEKNSEIHVTTLTLGSSGEVLSRETTILGKVFAKPTTTIVYDSKKRVTNSDNSITDHEIIIKDDGELNVIVDDLKSNEGLLVKINEYLNDGSLYSTHTIMYGNYPEVTAAVGKDSIVPKVVTVPTKTKFISTVTRINVNEEKSVVNKKTEETPGLVNVSDLISSIEKNETVILLITEYDEEDKIINETEEMYGRPLTFVTHLKIVALGLKGDIISEELTEISGVVHEDDILEQCRPNEIVTLITDVYDDFGKQLSTQSEVLCQGYEREVNYTKITQNPDDNTINISEFTDFQLPINLYKLDKELPKNESVIIDELIKSPRGEVIHTEQTILGKLIQVQTLIIRNVHAQDSKIINTRTKELNYFFDKTGFEKTIDSHESALIVTRLYDNNQKLLHEAYVHYGVKLSDYEIVALLSDLKYVVGPDQERVVFRERVVAPKGFWATALDVLLYILEVLFLVIVLYTIIAFFWKADFLTPLNDHLKPILDFTNDMYTKWWVGAIALALAALLIVLAFLPENKTSSIDESLTSESEPEQINLQTVKIEESISDQAINIIVKEHSVVLDESDNKKEVK